MHTPDHRQPPSRGKASRSRWRLALAAAGVVTVLSTAALVAPAVAATIRHSDGQAVLQRDVDAIRDTGAVGVQARVILEDGEHLVATSGVGNTETGEPVPPDGFFRMGSNTKTYTATVVLQLVDEGKLTLEDTVEQHLPGVVQGGGHDGGKITVRQLLQHTSGVPDYILARVFERFGEIESLEEVSIEEIREFFDHTYAPGEQLALALAQPPTFAPGDGWAYSNTNYILAGMLIEKLTGNPWHQEVAQRILTPLGLDDTVWPGESTTLPAPHARGYIQLTPDGPHHDITEVVDIGEADGALITTTDDLNRFFRALAAGKLLSPELLEEMRTTIPTDRDSDERYGLGLSERPLSCGGTYFDHGGSSPGSLAEVGVTADGQRSVAVSVTTQQGNQERALQQDQATRALIDTALCANG